MARVSSPAKTPWTDRGATGTRGVQERRIQLSPYSKTARVDSASRSPRMYSVGDKGPARTLAASRGSDVWVASRRHETARRPGVHLDAAVSPARGLPGALSRAPRTGLASFRTFVSQRARKPCKGVPGLRPVEGLRRERLQRDRGLGVCIGVSWNFERRRVRGSAGPHGGTRKQKREGGDSSADGAAFRTVLRATSDGASGQATRAVVSGASTAFRTVQKRGLSGPTWPRAGPAAGGSARVT